MLVHSALNRNGTELICVRVFQFKLGLLLCKRAFHLTFRMDQVSAYALRQVNMITAGWPQSLLLPTA